MAINLSFLDPEPLLFHSSSSSVILNEAEWTHYFSEHMVAPEIKLGSCNNNNNNLPAVLLQSESRPLTDSHLQGRYA
jgi:hypothetical protein